MALDQRVRRARRLIWIGVGLTLFGLILFGATLALRAQVRQQLRLEALVTQQAATIQALTTPTMAD
ncbi:MAG: hypothetical protein ACOYL5_18985 [Phototrophicaceae bacterium]|jgi:hypothetical protein